MIVTLLFVYMSRGIKFRPQSPSRSLATMPIRLVYRGRQTVHCSHFANFLCKLLLRDPFIPGPYDDDDVRVVRESVWSLFVQEQRPGRRCAILHLQVRRTRIFRQRLPPFRINDFLHLLFKKCIVPALKITSRASPPPQSHTHTVIVSARRGLFSVGPYLQHTHTHAASSIQDE